MSTNSKTQNNPVIFNAAQLSISLNNKINKRNVDQLQAEKVILEQEIQIYKDDLDGLQLNL